MESPEKRNANSNEGPTCCQARFSNNFQCLGDPPPGDKRGLVGAIHAAGRLGNSLQPGRGDRFATGAA